MSNRPDSAAPPEKAFNDLGRIIGRTIVDTDNFDLTFVGLPLVRGENERKFASLVVQNRDDRYARAPHSLVPGDHSATDVNVLQCELFSEGLRSARAASVMPGSVVSTTSQATIVLRRASMTSLGSN